MIERKNRYIKTVEDECRQHGEHSDAVSSVYLLWIWIRWREAEAAEVPRKHAR